MAASDRKTYVLYTVSGKEHKVLDRIRANLLQPDEEAFCPVVVRIKRYQGIDQEVQMNMYPGYIFIQTKDSRDFFNRVKMSKGTTLFQYVRLLRNNDYILPISEEEERMLEELCGENHICDLSRGYMDGDQVVITTGPLRNFTGKIRHINRHKKTARIATRLLNREVDVTVGLEIVKKIDSSL